MPIRPYKMTSSRPLEHLPLDADWSAQFPQCSRPFATSQLKRLEGWEDNTAASLGGLNHIELFLAATMDRLASVVGKTEEFLTSLNRELGDRVRHLIPDMEAWIQEVKLAAHLSESQAKSRGGRHTPTPVATV